MAKSIRSIGVLTSGGDSPGMNAFIRAAVRAGHHFNMNVFGVKNGLQGLIDAEISPMLSTDVSGIISAGGTILGTARSKSFYTKEGRRKAAEVVEAFGIEALVVCGGDGSFKGAYALYNDFNIPFIGLPGTIDNDMYGTDFTIGFATATNTAVEAIDKIRDTAESHRRLFFVEVMGRNCGSLALDAALAVGADAVLIPESISCIKSLVKNIKLAYDRGKKSYIVVVSEGDELGNAYQIREKVEALLGVRGHVCVLGHIQRGGAPSAFDRVLATRLGYEAVKTLNDGIINQFIGVEKGNVISTPIEDVIDNKTKIKNLDFEALLNIIASS